MSQESPLANVWGSLYPRPPSPRDRLSVEPESPRSPAHSVEGDLEEHTEAKLSPVKVTFSDPLELPFVLRRSPRGLSDKFFSPGKVSEKSEMFSPISSADELKESKKKKAESARPKKAQQSTPNTRLGSKAKLADPQPKKAKSDDEGTRKSSRLQRSRK